MPANAITRFREGSDVVVLGDFCVQGTLPVEAGEWCARGYGGLSFCFRVGEAREGARRGCLGVATRDIIATCFTSPSPILTLQKSR